MATRMLSAPVAWSRARACMRHMLKSCRVVLCRVVSFPFPTAYVHVQLNWEGRGNLSAFIQVGLPVSVASAVAAAMWMWCLVDAGPTSVPCPLVPCAASRREQAAADSNLFVFLRVGPYVDAEWDYGACSSSPLLWGLDVCQAGGGGGVHGCTV